MEMEEGETETWVVSGDEKECYRREKYKKEAKVSGL